MSRYIDADALECDTEWSEYHDGFTSYSQMAIDTAPSIDIVRCKECKFGEFYAVDTGEDYLTGLWCELNQKDCMIDDFCSRGEREGE